MALIYAGIGSRSTPNNILEMMVILGRNMAERGHLLRSGAADGADQAFEYGCDLANGAKEIYLPWLGFNKRNMSQRGVCGWPTKEAYDLAAEFHPNWAACKAGAMALHARNCHQVLGWHLDKPADLVICWTPDASGNGGTGQAIRLATALKIPVFDLADPRSFDKLENFPNI